MTKKGDTNLTNISDRPLGGGKPDPELQRLLAEEEEIERVIRAKVELASNVLCFADAWAARRRRQLAEKRQRALRRRT